MIDERESTVDWDDWQTAESADVLDDAGDATPLCPRCLNEVDPLDHYCGRCMYAVGRFTPNIPFVNIPFLCEPFARLWERIWRPRGETIERRVWYFALLVLAGLVSGFIWILPVAALAWWHRRPTPPGHCPGCGYDLRASSKRCPECGAEIVERGGLIPLVHARG